MKARIQYNGTWYYGEVYGKWEQFYMGIKINKFKGWKKVTDNCYTSLGAKIQLKLWKQKNISQEFEL